MIGHFPQSSELKMKFIWVTKCQLIQMKVLNCVREDLDVDFGRGIMMEQEREKS